jgi:hypothetical protein
VYIFKSSPTLGTGTIAQIVALAKIADLEIGRFAPPPPPSTSQYIPPDSSRWREKKKSAYRFLFSLHNFPHFIVVFAPAVICAFAPLITKFLLWYY